MSFREIIFVGKVQLQEPKEQMYFKALRIIIYILTRRYTVAENWLRNTIAIISVCVREFSSEATGQGFYSAAVLYIYPFEYMLTVSYKLLAFADSFCNSKDKMQSQHYGLFFFFKE